MKKIIANMEKFSFAQLTSNSDGKTSGSGTAGLYIVFIGGICFLLGCIDKMFLDKSVDILTQSIIFVSIGTALLGYRKSKDSGSSSEASSSETSDNKEEIKDTQINS
jgi:hypothetical protein